MNNNKDYTVEDFVLDPKFRKWILDPDENDDLYWEEWLKQHPHHVKKINDALSIVSKLPKVDYQFGKKDKHHLWQSILRHSLPEDKSETKDRSEKRYPSKIIPLYNTRSVKEKKRTGIRVGFYYRLIAGISIFLISSFLLLDKIIFEDKKEEPTVTKIVKRNPVGQKSTIFLGEGSEVILNSGSTITFYDDFGKKDRIIHLKGEAFFNVAKNQHLPFKVISNGLTTTALGTSFNVRSFGKETTKVALVSGKVLVEKNNRDTDFMILMPGEQAVLSEKDTAFIKDTFDLKQETGWKDGIIFFKDAKAEEVFAYLGKWYGVKITQVNKSSKSWNYSGEFKNMNLHSVLMSIGFTMDFEFSIADKHVKIKYLK